ncbi:MAG: diaminopimelate decarboxylase [Candidatus Caldatribacteriaceae bacterium]
MLGNKRVNAQNHLEIAGIDVVDLAEKLGTPLYVFDEEMVRAAAREYKEAFSRLYPDFQVAYAGKAFLCSYMCQVVKEEDLWLDVVSGGEYYLAYTSGFPVERVIFHGNNKTEEERKLVLKEGVGRWVVDSTEELDNLLEEARGVRVRVPVLFRLTPGIDPHTHAYITTGKVDSKFGLPLLEGVAERTIKRALDSPYLEVRGVHCHIGSQIDTLEPFLKAAQVMLQFMDDFRKKYHYTFVELDLGGGLGVPYLDADRDRFPSISSYVEAICGVVKEQCAVLSYPLPRIIVEPGRSIVNLAGSTIYRVGTVKEVPGVRKYVAVDGGMTDNPRHILYGAKYQAVVGNRVQGEVLEKVAVVGKCCESGDVLIPEIDLPAPRTGDILVVEGTGAYNHSMASNYNLIPRPGVVFLRNGKAELVVRPESFCDLVRRDLVPEYSGEGGKENG